MLTDAGLLERVVANLVSNAVRVSRGTPVRVRRRRCSPTRSTILVVDRGPGRRRRTQRERMFEPFQRLDDTGPVGSGSAWPWPAG